MAGARPSAHRPRRATGVRCAVIWLPAVKRAAQPVLEEQHLGSPARQGRGCRAGVEICCAGRLEGKPGAKRTLVCRVESRRWGASEITWRTARTTENPGVAEGPPNGKPGWGGCVDDQKPPRDGFCFAGNQTRRCLPLVSTFSDHRESNFWPTREENCRERCSERRLSDRASLFNP